MTTLNGGRMRVVNRLGLTVVLGVTVGCGQEPSFVQYESEQAADAISRTDEYGPRGNVRPGSGAENPSGRNDRAIDSNGDPEQSGGLGSDQHDEEGPGAYEDPGDPTGDGEPSGPDDGGGGGETGDDLATPPPAPDDIVIPAADSGETADLRRCLMQWTRHPFEENITRFRRIHASVTVFGFGNAINDTEVTDEPELVLVDAAVNVGGAVRYRLMNPNGYYCLRVGVNVRQQLDIDIHCNARLTQPDVSVNVGSDIDDAAAAIGVHVGSRIRVNQMDRSGGGCG